MAHYQSKMVESVLRKNMHGHKREGIRFLLAVWPETWWWLLRAQYHLWDLPALDGGQDNETTEMALLLHRMGELGTELTNGKLRAAVVEQIHHAGMRLSAVSIQASGKRDHQADPWEWWRLSFKDFLRDKDRASLCIAHRGTHPGDGSIHGPSSANPEAVTPALQPAASPEAFPGTFHPTEEESQHRMNQFMTRILNVDDE